MRVEELGIVPYRQAWRLQEQIHSEVLAGGEERLLLVEHPPVITMGRRGEIEGPKHLVATSDALARLGVELVQSDRGGDITFHGPGQIVAYPIVRLNDHGLSVGGYVRKLEEIVIATLAGFGVAARRIDKCVGVWVDQPAGGPDKICAIGVRIRRGVSMHGIALNVNTDLRFFELIVPCGLREKGVTSLCRLLEDRAPDIAQVRRLLARRFREVFEEKQLL